MPFILNYHCIVNLQWQCVSWLLKYLLKTHYLHVLQNCCQVFRVLLKDTWDAQRLWTSLPVKAQSPCSVCHYLFISGTLSSDGAAKWKTCVSLLNSWWAAAETRWHCENKRCELKVSADIKHYTLDLIKQSTRRCKLTNWFVAVDPAAKSLLHESIGVKIIF